MVLSRAQKRKKKKTCRHSPSCNKILAYSSRLRHYRHADPNKIQPSVSPESSGDDSDSDTSPIAGSISPTPSICPTPPRSSLSSPVTESIQPIPYSPGSGSGLERYDSQVSKSESEQEVSSERDSDREDRVALEEMLVDLTAMMGPEDEADLWRIRKDLLTLTSVILTHANAHREQGYQ